MEEENAKGTPRRSTSPSSRIDQVDSDMAVAMSLQQQERATPPSSQIDQVDSDMAVAMSLQQQERAMPPSSRIDQVDSDMAVEMSLQQQERESTMLPAIQSESEEEEEFSDYVSGDEEDDGNDDPDYEYFSSQGLEPESGFLEGGEDSSTEPDMEEDDIDPDELSYEELMELGEIIGEERRGLSLDQISKCLTPLNCQSLKTGIDRCVICQVEYEEGEKMVTLPCEHPYHSDCISQWLQLKRTCPICTTEVSPPKVSRIV